jgi:peptidoglycan hydrolase-like protein with peptidoglycan-binding domain
MNKITSPVGRGVGNTNRADVLTVQKLLNQHRRPPLSPIKEDGLVGPKTIAAIEDFQRRVVSLSQPDGRVDPGRTTFQRLSARSSATTVSGAKKFVIEMVRKWETSESTISEFTVPFPQGQEIAKGFFLERPGPDTKQPGLRKRIPEGTFNLKWQTQTNLAGVRPYLPVPWLYNEDVPATRMIYIHNGNYPRNTDGCLLVGTTRTKDFVGASVDALKRLKAFCERVGIENVKLRITSNYQAKP